MPFQTLHTEPLPARGSDRPDIRKSIQREVIRQSAETILFQLQGKSEYSDLVSLQIIENEARAILRTVELMRKGAWE